MKIKTFTYLSPFFFMKPYMQLSDKKKSRHFLLLLSILFCSIFVTAGISQISGEEPPLDIRINKIVGTNIGDKIEGKFRITATGGDNITALSLLFNGTQVASSPNNSLFFKFETADYGVGTMNITLIGEDSVGLFSQITEMRVFLSPEMNIWLILGILAIVIPILAYRAFRWYRAKTLVKPSHEDKKNRIKIDIDKDF